MLVRKYRTKWLVVFKHHYNFHLVHVSSCPTFSFIIIIHEAIKWIFFKYYFPIQSASIQLIARWNLDLHVLNCFYCSPSAQMLLVHVINHRHPGLGRVCARSKKICKKVPQVIPSAKPQEFRPLNHNFGLQFELSTPKRGKAN